MVWARNISTALMYSFENRFDCHATDEPLYASFLLNSRTPHPGAEEVIEKYETDLGKLITTLTGPIPDEKQIWYQKHMCHHIPEDSDISWIDDFKNCFLIRTLGTFSYPFPRLPTVLICFRQAFHSN